MKKRILIVDDSPFIRRILGDWISGLPEFEIIGTASNGEEAVMMAKSLRPDAITLDIEMPKRDGLSALSEIMKVCPTRVLMASSLTTKGAQATIRALELGAVDFITKASGSLGSNKQEFLDKLREVSGAKLVASPKAPAKISSARCTGSKIIVIASSTGGPKALASLWSALPKNFPVPILIVQHMPPGFTTSFAGRLDSFGTVPCAEARDGDPILPGRALLAPGGYHMTITKDQKVSLNQNPSIHGVRPAADFLFLSAVEHYGNQAIGVVLTGMGRDGADGSVALRKAGARTLGESESSCTIYGMPRAAMLAGGIEAEFPLQEMAAAIVASLGGKKTNAA